ncbi:MAG: hypothetical protein COB60_04195 [Flavobacteriaceae bacterium]|nr:MAG: hypothetical protein COB60_04195 [Flavobacteriaceae bacterium]
MKTYILKPLRSKQYFLLALALTLSLLSFGQNKDKDTLSQLTIKESGAIIINSETHFYTLSPNDITNYYNRFGQEVNSKGKITNKGKNLKITDLTKKRILDDSANSGEVIINDKVYYYFKSNSGIKYYDRKGNLVDKNGKLKTI